MRLESFADDRADGEDGCGGINAVETDDAACTWNGEADALVKVRVDILLHTL